MQFSLADSQRSILTFSLKPFIVILTNLVECEHHLDRVKRIWYLSHMRTAKVQASLRIRAVSPEPSLLAHTSSGSRGTFRQKARSLAPLNGWACAVEICHNGMLEDTNSLDGAHLLYTCTLAHVLDPFAMVLFQETEGWIETYPTSQTRTTYYGS